jgi:hypothetical protein
LEYINQEIATFHLWRKDRRAFVASSSAIALSILPQSCDPTDAAPDEPGSSKESAWRAAYGAVKPPSSNPIDCWSDSFLQQTTANADRIRDVEQRIQLLGVKLKYPVGDRDNDEKARRKAFKRFVLPPLRHIAVSLVVSVVDSDSRLAGIVAKLKQLSEQHGILRFLKNADHSNILNDLVQELSYADYQVRDTNSIARAV